MPKTKSKKDRSMQLLLLDPYPTTRRGPKRKPAPEGMKYCRACDDTKSVTEVNRRSSSKDGLNGYCKSCKQTMNQQWKGNHSEEVRAYNQLLSPISSVL